MINLSYNKNVNLFSIKNLKYIISKYIFPKKSHILVLISIFFTNVVIAKEQSTNEIPKVIIHPEMDSSIVINLLKTSKKLIAFSALSIPSEDFAREIVNAYIRGVKVFVIITNPFFEAGIGYSSMSKKFAIDVQSLLDMKDRLQRDVAFTNILTDNNIYPHYIDRNLYINHQKLLIIDDLAFISTSPRCEKRDFCIKITKKEEVQVLKKLFFSDYNQNKISDSENAELEKLGFVLGPKDQRKKLENLLLSAKKSIHIYAADFNDKSICSIIENLLQKSINVYLINTPNFFGYNEQSLNADYYLKKIKQFGAKIRIVREPFVHSKIIIVDANEETERKMYFGSCNIFSNSIDYTRELGIITRSDEYINPIFSTFLKDWDRGADF